MEKVQGQKILDSLAISASTLCVLHCLVTPFLLILVPVISSTFVADELFHKIFVAFILVVVNFYFYLEFKKYSIHGVEYPGSSSRGKGWE